jgi:hypothetical protein
MRGSDSVVGGGAGGGRHRREDHYQGRHRRVQEVRAAGRRALNRPTTAALLVSIGIGSLSIAGAAPSDVGSVSLEASAGLSPPERAREAASRSSARAPSVAGTPTASEPVAAVSKPRAATPSPRPSATTPAAAAGASPSATRKPNAAQNAKVLPVGALTQKQMDYAGTIVRVGQQLGMSSRGYVIAVATALQESQLQNFANYGVPASLTYPHDAVGYDHDSIGLFQQRPSTGWGTVAEIMDPATSARKFYLALAQVYGWQYMALAAAAQAVQVSAFPDAYAQHEPLATMIVNAFL